MEMEELNKSQIVLLTLLVSFVTSMATGIVTVSLMEQGVTPVTNTVNSIVERTKEVIIKVQEPRETQVITEEKTVIIKQADLVASAVDKVYASTVAIYEEATLVDIAEETTEETSASTQVAAAAVAIDEAVDTEVLAESTLKFVARGVILIGGLVATDSSVLQEGIEYTIISSDGTRESAALYSKASGIGLLQTELDYAIDLGDTTDLSRGVTVVALSGTDRLRVVTAIVSDIMISNDVLTAIETSLGGVMPGSVLINLDGQLIGISTGASRAHGKSWFSPVGSIKGAMQSLSE